MNANLNGLPDDATLARLASELFAALPSEAAGLDGRPGAAAAGQPQAAAGPPRITAGLPADGRPASPAATELSNIPDSLEESGVTVHAPPHREAVPGWDSLTSAAAVPAGLGGVLANPYAPIHVQEFYFVDPPQLSQPAAPVTRRPGRPGIYTSSLSARLPDSRRVRQRAPAGLA